MQRSRYCSFCSAIPIVYEGVRSKRIQRTSECSKNSKCEKRIGPVGVVTRVSAHLVFQARATFLLWIAGSLRWGWCCFRKYGFGFLVTARAQRQELRVKHTRMYCSAAHHPCELIPIGSADLIITVVSLN